MADETKPRNPNWGGKRKGSGRPVGTGTAPPRIRYGFSLPQPEADILNETAAAEGMTVHAWIVRLVRKRLGLED